MELPQETATVRRSDFPIRVRTPDRSVFVVLPAILLLTPSGLANLLTGMALLSGLVSRELPRRLLSRRRDS